MRLAFEAPSPSNKNFGDIPPVKTLLSIALAATLLAPAAAFADASTAPAQTTATTANAAASTTATSAAAPSNATKVAMTKHTSAQDTGYGKQANDDRQGLARIQEQAHQLGANN